ncbi:MAG TPA: hypothetical protein VHA30_03530 [Patescibacteria group bacterium]|nr:hypothetical protein [Patescibacteria group bacterium]
MNSPEQKLAQEFDEYQKVGKDNPNVDVGMLMLNALQNSKDHAVPAKTKRWAYLVSIGVPPFGFLFALKFFLDDRDDARDVAWTCIILTVISVFAFWLLGKIMLSGSGTSVQQIEQIKPSDIQQLTQ